MHHMYCYYDFKQDMSSLCCRNIVSFLDLRLLLPILRLIMLPLAYKHSYRWDRNPQLVSYRMCVLLHAIQSTTWGPWPPVLIVQLRLHSYVCTVMIVQLRLHSYDCTIMIVKLWLCSYDCPVMSVQLWLYS